MFHTVTLFVGALLFCGAEQEWNINADFLQNMGCLAKIRTYELT